MPKYNDPLTTAWYAFLLYLSEVKRHERDAARFQVQPELYWLEDAERYISLARYRAAKWLVRFMRLVKHAGGFVYVDKFVYVETT